MSSGFISEAEIEERRKIRQQEWEKVRQPGQPEEPPEEEQDNRSLFERLEEQRQKKELDFEETHRLKNMIKGLDDDEIEFLDLVDRTKMEAEKRLLNEEAKELKLFRSRKAALQEQTMAQKIEDEVAPAISTINEAISSGIATPHNKALANLVRKRAASEKLPSPPAKKSTDEMSKNNSDTKESKSPEAPAENCGDVGEIEDKIENPVLKYPSAMQCIGILPGIGSYISEDSSDSDKTSNSDLEDGIFDLRGHKVQKNVSKQELS